MSKKLTLQMSAVVQDKIEQLMEDSGAESPLEVIQWALSVYEFLWNAQVDGAAIRILKNGQMSALNLKPVDR